MLTCLRLKNFKSWQDTGNIPLRPITGVFGANSSGKTSLLQSLLLLKQTADSTDRGLVFHFGDEYTLANLGDFRSVIYRHEAVAPLTLTLDWLNKKPFKVTDTRNRNRKVVRSERLGFSVTACQPTADGAGGIVVKEMVHRVGDAAFGLRMKTRSKYDLFAEGTEFRFVRSVGRNWPLSAPIKCYGFPDQVRAYFQNAGFVADLELEFEECLKRVYYLGPLRARPARRYVWTGAQPFDMGASGESVVDAILASRERGEMIGLGRGRPRVTLEQYVAQWLKKLGLIHDFRVAPLAEGSPVFEVTIRKSPRSPGVLITDVGFGVSQLLPVLVLCFYVPQGSTVVLEQPEIHLHPAIQSGLADVLIDAWKKRRVQILLESHSEHLLRRIQRRVAEEDISDTDVGLYFCSVKRHRSRLRALELDTFGNVRNWPDGFFGDDFGEIAAMSEAALRRKQKGNQ